MRQQKEEGCYVLMGTVVQIMICPSNHQSHFPPLVWLQNPKSKCKSPCLVAREQRNRDGWTCDGKQPKGTAN